MTDVFVSYSHEDAEFARKIVRALQAEGFSVWWDHTIPPGQSWESHIQKHIEAAKSCIVVWSATSVGSDWVKEEATVAYEAQKLLPIRTHDAVQPPMGFRRLQTGSFEGWRGQRDFTPLTLLLGEVRRFAAAPSASEDRTFADAPTPPQPRLFPRAQERAPVREFSSGGRAVLIGVIAFMAIAAAGGAYWFSGRASAPAWEAVDANDAASLRAFIAGNPGDFRDDAERALAELELRAYEAASENGSIAALQAFLRDFPESEHAVAARGRIAELRTLESTETETPAEGVAVPTDPDLVPPGSFAPSDPGTAGPAPLTPPSEPESTEPPPDAPPG